MENGNGWEQLQATASPVSYFDAHTGAWVTGSYEGNLCATAVKLDSDAADAAVSSAAGQHGMAMPPGGVHACAGAGDLCKAQGTSS